MNLAVVSTEWLKMEFEQNFIQLRDRDQRLAELLKFHAGLVCSVGTAAVALLGLKGFGQRVELIGMLLVGTGVVGTAVLLCMVAFRRYFVQSARQINAIRQFAASEMGEDLARRVLVLSTSPDQPRYWNARSAHTAVLALVAFLNAALSGVGVYAICEGRHVAAGWAAVLAGLAFSFLAGVAGLCFRCGLRDD